MAAHFIVIFAGWIGLRYLGFLTYPFLAVAIGNSLAALGFAAHDLNHGTIIRGGRLRYCLEVSMAVGVFVLPQWWKVIDRRHHGTGEHMGGAAYQVLRIRSWWLHLRRAEPGPLPHLPPASGLVTGPVRQELRERRFRLTIELAIAIAVQVAIYHIVGRSWTAYLFAGPAATVAALTVAMAYVATNHYRSLWNPGGDLFDTTISVAVPRVLDRMHFHVSYHTEHHIFPTLNSDYYPLVSALLSQQFGDRYRRIPLSQAWGELWLGGRSGKERQRFFLEKEAKTF